MDILITYIFIINEVSFLFMLIDKRKAVRHAWRIPEATLLGIAAIGGSLGALLAMRLFRHKTKHPRFFLGLPILLVLHGIILIYLYCK